MIIGLLFDAKIRKYRFISRGTLLRPLHTCLGTEYIVHNDSLSRDKMSDIIISRKHPQPPPAFAPRGPYRHGA